MLLPDTMILKNLDARMEELDKLTLCPEIKFKSRPTDGYLFWRGVSDFLADPKNDELIWQLFKRFVLKKK